LLQYVEWLGKKIFKILMGKQARKNHEDITHFKKKIRTGRAVQVVEHLPSKCEALSSNSSPAQKKRFFKMSILPLSTHILEW
jgi:hypothetical protein